MIMIQTEGKEVPAPPLPEYLGYEVDIASTLGC